MFDSKYIEGSGGSLCIFSRPSGTEVSHANGVEHNYTTAGREIVVQWGGDATYDSGYHSEVWADTPTNRRKAWKYFNDYY